MLEKLDSLKKLLNEFISLDFQDNKFTYVGSHGDKLINTLKAVGVNYTYTLDSSNLYQVTDVKGGEWINIQMIVPVGTTFNLFLEWSNSNDVNSLWSNAIIDSNFISVTGSNGLVIDIKGFSFFRTRIESLSPSSAEIEFRFRYI